MFAPAAGATVGALAGQASAMQSKKKLSESQKKDRAAIGTGVGTLLGLGVSAKYLNDISKGDVEGHLPPTPPGKKHKFKFEGKTYKKPQHPSIIKKRGNLIKVDFAKKPGFVAGFKKVAALNIPRKAKTLGKHLHKYRKEYIMGVGSTGSAAAALNSIKEKK